MPIASDPSTEFPFTLKCDLGKQDAARFFFRFLTLRQVNEVRRRIDLNISAKLPPEKDQLDAADILCIGLVRWENLFDPDGRSIPTPADGVRNDLGITIDALSGALTPEEIWTLINSMCRQSAIAVEDKKKSASPSQSDGAASAAPA